MEIHVDWKGKVAVWINIGNAKISSSWVRRQFENTQASGPWTPDPSFDVPTEKEKKIQSVLNKTARYGFLPEWSPKTIDELLESSDITITLFKAALKKSDHVIHPLLPPPKPPGYNLRKRSHGLLPTTQSNLLRKNFVYRMLFKDIY